MRSTRIALLLGFSLIGSCAPPPAQPSAADVVVPPAASSPAGSLAAQTPTRAPSSPRRSGAFRWLDDAPQAAKEARAENRLLLLFFYASWDMAGMQLQKVSLADAAVVAELEKRFVAAKIDVTNDEEPRAKKAVEAYSVDAMPTILLLDPQGREVLRIVGFLDAEGLLARLSSVR